MAERALVDLTPAEVLQVALDESTTDQRCDEAWVAALASRVRAARGAEHASADLAAAERWARVSLDGTVPSHLVTLLAEYERRGAELERLRPRAAELEAEHERVQDFHHDRMQGALPGSPARMWAEQLGDAIAGRYVADQRGEVVYGVRLPGGLVAHESKHRNEAEMVARAYSARGAGGELVQAHRGPWGPVVLAKDLPGCGWVDPS